MRATLNIPDSLINQFVLLQSELEISSISVSILNKNQEEIP